MDSLINFPLGNAKKKIFHTNCFRPLLKENGYLNSFYLVIENSCFCSLFLFSVNAVPAVITSRTISDSRYYKDEKEGFEMKKYLYFFKCLYFTFYLNVKRFLAKKNGPSVPLFFVF